MRAAQSTKWPLRKLGDFLRLKHGYAFKGEFFADSGPYIVLTPGNFFDSGGFKHKDQEKHYTGFVPEAFVLSRGDLIVAMTEQQYGLLGSSAMVPASDLYLHNQRLGLVTDLNVEELDRQFLYYLFNTHGVRAQIQATANGAKVRHTSPSRIYDVEIRVPPICTQQKIASILSAYDDLIENNNRRIRILEEMAQAIYREWFVRFRFPGYKEVKMVESELGPIPDGWRVLPVGEVVDTVGGGTPSTKKPECWENGDIDWFTPSDLTSVRAMFLSGSRKKITGLGLQQSSARMFPAYSVLMTSRATIGVIAINTRPACTNQGFITCIPNERLSALQIYFWITDNKNRITSVASGATYKEINKTEFREFPTVVADPETTAGFLEMANPIAKQIEVLLNKNSNLRETRDLLLPKLISGEIDVENMDIVTEAAE